MRKTRQLAVWSALIALLGPTAMSSAQERHMGGVGITVFTDSNFRGSSATFREDVPDLNRFGLNDQVSSLRVAPGEQWEVCEHQRYQGRCVVVSGDEPQLRRNSWSDVISSLRRVRGSAGGPGFPPGRPEPPRGDWYIVLYDKTDYRGHQENYKGPVSDLYGSSRRAQSVTIGRGVWQLCDRPNFSGRCVTLNESSPDLTAFAMRNRVTSLRPFGEGGGSIPPPPSDDWYIVLFDQPGYRGHPTNYKGPVSNLSGSGRRAQSVTIGRGVWELCEGPNFSGRCVTLNQSVPDLRTYGLRNRITSVRPKIREPR